MRNLTGWQAFRGVSLVSACLLSACMLRPEGFERDTGASTNPTLFRNLAELPEKPPAPPAEAIDQAVQSLTADRATTEAAADMLRREPFVTPAPPPPRSEF